jgi:NADPH:quinone reductase-like Zn-dependent oxidoreductase
MKAIVITKYGPPEVFKIEEVPKPAPKSDQVLVEVHGVSVTYSTMKLISGQPFIGRLMGLGLTQPK